MVSRETISASPPSITGDDLTPINALFAFLIQRHRHLNACKLDLELHTRLNSWRGRAFRGHILSKGSSAPADELHRRFMGRDPELEPLLVRSGLAEPQVA